MRPGKERSILIGKARQMEEAAQIADFLAVQPDERWVLSPLRSALRAGVADRI